MPTSSETLSQLFEGAAEFVARIQGHAANTLDEMLFWAEQLAFSMPEDEQIKLLNGHPRIGATPSTGTQELQDRLDRLNDTYESRFGFRFVIFVAGRPRAEVADMLESRLSATRAEELERGLSDVFAIARDRLSKLSPALEEAR
jgi:2-oxo-4-hydroxy-4-carboxy--5-ureidoimidazoline (OHCU) decarboxylase